MSSRIYLPIYYRGTNRGMSIKLIPRHYASRHLLRSSPLPLCTKNGSSIWNLRRIYPLIPTTNRSNTSLTMVRRSILRNVCGSKPNILPSTLPRTKGHTTTILRLPGCYNNLKRPILSRGHRLIRIITNIHCYHLRSIRSSTKSSC